VLRVEATVHNTKELRCRRGLDNFGEIITRLAGIAGRFTTALDCASTGFLHDGILDELPLPAQAGTGKTAGIDLNKPRIRAALAAVPRAVAAPPLASLAVAGGGYRCLPSLSRYSAAVTARPSYELEGCASGRCRRWTKRSTRSPRTCALGRPLQALCSLELRSPAPFDGAASIPSKSAGTSAARPSSTRPTSSRTGSSKT
jgi:hypothetical protein